MSRKVSVSPKVTLIPFTAEGYEAVGQKLLSLREERKAVLIRLQLAREMGDLSENGAYKAARWELGGIDRQIRRLTYQQRAGRVVSTSSNERVEFGCTVTILSAQGELVYQLVNGYESDPREGKLSIISPLGKALLGKCIGETVSVIGPTGLSRDYSIVSIRT